MYWNTRMLLFVLLWALSGLAACSACKSQFCSVGKVAGGFTGDISTAQGLRKLIDSTAYNNEMMFTIVTIEDRDEHLQLGSFFMNLLQLHTDVHAQGFAHFFILTRKEQGCALVRQAYEGIELHMPSCVWDSQDIPKGLGPEGYKFEEEIWHYKHRMMLRLTRLGVWVMYFDIDTIIFEDPYQYVKGSGPFAHLNMINTPENPIGIQASFFYIQNVAPDGPITWMLWDIVELPLRWLDDNFKFIFSLGKVKPDANGNNVLCMTFDQTFWDDAWYSALLGQVVRPNMLTSCWPEEIKPVGAKQAIRTWDIRESMTALVNVTLRANRTRVNHPAGHVRPISNKGEMDGTGMTQSGFFDVLSTWEGVPDAGKPLRIDQPPLGVLQYQPIEQSGSLVQGLRAMLKADCPSCPWWADNSVAAKEQGAPHRPVQPKRETTAFAPAWFIASAGLYSRAGTWSMPTGSRQVMGHIHRLTSELFHGFGVKSGLRKLTGHFDWYLADRVATNLGAKSRPTVFSSRVDPPRLLALSPNVDLRRTQSLEEYSRIVAGILQVAALLNRTAVIPDLACGTPWVLEPGYSRCEAPTLSSGQVYPYTSPPRVQLLPGTILKVHSALVANISGRSQAWAPGAGQGRNGTCGVVGTVPVDGQRMPSALQSKHYKFVAAPFMDDECYAPSAADSHGAISEVDFQAWLVSMCAASCLAGGAAPGSSAEAAAQHTPQTGTRHTLLAGAGGGGMGYHSASHGASDVCGLKGSMKRRAGPWVPSFVSASLSRGAVLLPPGQRSLIGLKNTSLESTLLWLQPEDILGTVARHKQEALPLLFLGHPVAIDYPGMRTKQPRVHETFKAVAASCHGLSKVMMGGAVLEGSRPTYGMTGVIGHDGHVSMRTAASNIS